jgi:hypothetical protein
VWSGFPLNRATSSLTENMTINVEENIKKARRSAYGLFGGAYHGNNGLDPDTLIHLFKTPQNVFNFYKQAIALV